MKSKTLTVLNILNIIAWLMMLSHIVVPNYIMFQLGLLLMVLFTYVKTEIRLQKLESTSLKLQHMIILSFLEKEAESGELFSKNTKEKIKSADKHS